MTRAAWTTGALSDTDLDARTEELAKVLRYPEAQRRTFLRKADEAIAEYRELRKPSQEDLQAREYRMERLAKTGRAFARAVAAIDDDSLDLLELSIWAAEGKGGEIPIDAVAGLRDAGKLAGRVAAGAQHWARHPSGPGPRYHRSVAVDGLIGELGRAYCEAFGEDRTFKPPNASLNGRFMKALASVLSQADLGLRVAPPPNKGKPAGDAPSDDSGQVISRSRVERILNGPKK